MGIKTAQNFMLIFKLLRKCEKFYNIKVIGKKVYTIGVCVHRYIYEYYFELEANLSLRVH
jgi:hypothetical protein